jgi:hypothetical protein
MTRPLQGRGRWFESARAHSESATNRTVSYESVRIHPHTSAGDHHVVPRAVRPAPVASLHHRRVVPHLRDVGEEVVEQPFGVRGGTVVLLVDVVEHTLNALL